MVLLGPMFDYLTGKHGHSAQFASGLVYTVACVSGSIFAHFLALKTEHGKNAVGYSKKYAQIPVEVWVRVQEIVADYDRTKGLAETAYAVGVGSLPDSGISAKKVGGVQVTTGL